MKLNLSYNFESKEIYTVLWLNYFSITCYIFAILDGLTGGRFCDFIMVIPFFHYPFFSLFLMLRVEYQPNKYSNYRYIAKNYPEIWKKLRAKSIIDYNGRFEQGMYDDGNDSILNEIKYRQSIFKKLFLKSFFLIGKTWLIVGFFGLLRMVSN